jgi:hypothetical protein
MLPTFAWSELRRLGFSADTAEEIEAVLDHWKPGGLTADEVLLTIFYSQSKTPPEYRLFGKKVITNDQPSLFGDHALHYRAV